MTKTDKKFTEIDQNLDPKIEKKSLFFSCFSTQKFKKIGIFIMFFTRELPNPNPVRIRKSQRLRTRPGSLRNWPPAPDQIRKISYQKPGV